MKRQPAKKPQGAALKKSQAPPESLEAFQKEQEYYVNLMQFIHTNERFSKLTSEAPTFYKHISSFGHEVRKKIELFSWQPSSEAHSCEDVCTIEKASQRKAEIF